MRTLAGTGTLIRLILRRDRLRLPLWVAVIALPVIGLASSWSATFTTEQELASRASLMSNPAIRAFNGPGHGLSDYTIGAMVAYEALGILAVVAALMGILLTVRHTRAEEESGRSELVRAAVVGRYAAPVAALVVVWGTCAVLALVTGFGLTAVVPELPLSGSLLFGASLASVAATFAAVAVVTAQISAGSRTATAVAVVVLAVTFALRAVGDVSDTALSWLSPIGWAQATRAFVDERWWPLLLPVAAALLLTLLALRLSTQRDLGAGLVAPRPGPPGATAALASPLGLAWRLQRSTLLGWSLGLFGFGIAFGTVVGEVETYLADNPQFEEILGTLAGTTLLDSYLGMVALLTALLATAASIQLATRARSEETAGRVEPLLATRLSRTGWLSSHLTLALVGGGFALLCGALGLGLAAASQSDTALLPRLLGAGLAYVPAVWLTVGLVTALFGLAPRIVAAGWLVVAYAAFVGLFADALELPGWARELSPFTHVPRLPGEVFTATPLVVLAAGAAALAALGVVAFGRRGVNVA